MFSKCIDRRVGHQKKKKGKKILGINNSTYHEPLSEEWIERRVV